MNCRIFSVASATLVLASFLSSQSLAIPIAQNDERTLPRNGAEQTINVLENDSSTDVIAGVTPILTVVAVTAPINAATGAAFGTTAINAANQVVFTSPFEFDDTVETITFNYTVADEAGDTAVGLVTITLTGPLLTFAAGENEIGVAATIESVCDDFLDATDAELSAGQTLLAEQCAIIEAIAGNNADNSELLARVVDQITPEETVAQTRLAIDNNRTQIKAVAQRVNQQRIARNTNGATRNYIALNGRGYVPEQTQAPGAGDESFGARPRFGLFASGQIDTAERDRTDLENGYDADTVGVVVGADYFLTNNFLVGSTVGYSQNDLEYNNSDGELDAKITTLSLFGAYFFGDFSLYAQGSFGWLDYASLRNISYGSGDIGTEAVITSTTGGNQASLNTRADWQWSKNALTVTPYVRFDYLATQVNSYEEIGTSGLEQAIGDQESSQITAALGLQASYVINMNWGVLTPNVELSYLSEANSERDPITARFVVDTDPSRIYSISNDGGDTAFYQATLGASAIFPRGISAFFNYSGFFGYDNLSASQIQFGIRSEF